MSNLELLTIILLALLAQVAVFALFGFFRHWQNFRRLRHRVEDLEGQPSADVFVASAPPAAHGWDGFRELRVQRRVLEDPAGSVCSIYLAPADGSALPPFEPGQYLTFQLPLTDPATGANRNIVRCYSLSDRPGTGYYRVSIKRALAPADIPEALPGVASNHFHDHVQEGDVLRVKAPGGHFHLDKETDAPVVLVGGGIGITPMLSMLGATLRDQPDREVWLFYGVRNSAEHIMKAQLEELARTHANFHLHVCYSKPAASDTLGRDYQHEGHVDVTLLRLTLPLQAYHFYVCGPRAMMETLVPAMHKWGIPPAHIHHEAFGPASLPPPAGHARAAVPVAGATTGLNVTFARSGQSFAWDGSASYLLDFAEEHGIAVNSGCRAGGCGSCQTTIEAGEVEYPQAPDFDPEPGTCLLCVARPKTDLVLSA